MIAQVDTWLLLPFVCVQPVIKHGLLSFHPSKASCGLAQSPVTICTVSASGSKGICKHWQTPLLRRVLYQDSYKGQSKIVQSHIAEVFVGLLLSPRMSNLVSPSPAPQRSAPTFSQTESFNLPGSDGSLRAQTLGGLPLSQNSLPFSQGIGWNRLSPSPPEHPLRQHPFKAALFSAVGATVLI